MCRENRLFDDLGVAVALRGLPGLLPGQGSADIGVHVGVVVRLPLVVGDGIARFVVLLNHVDAAIDWYGIGDVDVDLPGIDDLAGGCDSLDASRPTRGLELLVHRRGADFEFQDVGRERSGVRDQRPRQHPILADLVDGLAPDCIPNPDALNREP
ncbi:hypothetical protein D9M69_313460 [compost metagenome]